MERIRTKEGSFETNYLYRTPLNASDISDATPKVSLKATNEYYGSLKKKIENRHWIGVCEVHTVNQIEYSGLIHV